MTSYLSVAVYCGGSFLKIQSLKNCILAETLFYGEAGILYFPFFIQCLLLLLFLGLQFLVIGKKVKLLNISIMLGGVLVNHMVCGNVQSSDEQIGIDYSVVELNDGLRDEHRR